mgnify:CR=1 FL=1
MSTLYNATEETLLDNMLRTMQFEGGYKKNVYLDTEGYPTIGYGHKLSNVRYEKGDLPEEYKNMSWSEDESRKSFLSDYFEKESRVKTKFGEQAYNKLPDKAKSILIDLAFNMGSTKLFDEFPGFIADMYKGIKTGNYQDAAQELKYKNPDKGNMQMSNWWDQVGGDTTESKNEVRSGNRATSTFDILGSLINL